MMHPHFNHYGNHGTSQTYIRMLNITDPHCATHTQTQGAPCRCSCLCTYAKALQMTKKNLSLQLIQHGDYCSWIKSCPNCTFLTLHSHDYSVGNAVTHDFRGCAAGEKPPFNYCYHVNDYGVQCTIGARNCEITLPLLSLPKQSFTNTL